MERRDQEIKKKISNYYELQMKAKAMEMQSGQILNTLCRLLWQA
jgi:hypothetical protein